MTDKMISFLKHVNIENIDDFDIDFEMVAQKRVLCLAQVFLRCRNAFANGV